MRQVTTEDLLGLATAVDAEMLEFRAQLPLEVSVGYSPSPEILGCSAQPPYPRSRASSMGRLLTNATR